MYLVTAPDKEIAIIKLGIEAHNVVGVLPVFPGAKSDNFSRDASVLIAPCRTKCRKVGLQGRQTVTERQSRVWTWEERR